MIRFDGQVAVVTGSGRGLGAAYAALLAARGASVLVNDAGVASDGIGNDATVADAVVQTITKAGGTALANDTNLVSPEAGQKVIDMAIHHFGRVDILIHNAGVVAFTPIEKMPSALFERMLQLHVAAPFALTQAAWPHMQRQRYGRIVFTTSGRALSQAAAQTGLSAYAMGKIAPLGLMYTLAIEGEPWGIRANAIAPVAATRMLQRHVSPQTFRPEHVAPVVAYLASSHCDQSGMVVRARNGHVATGQWSFNDGMVFDPATLTPEAIAENWKQRLDTPIQR